MDGRAAAARVTGEGQDAPGPATVGPARRGPSRAASSALGDLVAVVDRLRSPGGCPWYAELTHASLLPYAVEEVHEVVEAVETEDRDGLREELGDLLLQVVLHARLAQEHLDAPFDLDDVASTAAAKLRRRNPHVFAGEATGVSATGDEAAETLDVATVHRRYLRLKQAEKQRDSALDGIPPTLPALARARKVLDRVHRSGLDDVVAGDASGDLGDRLLALVAEAGPGVDAEAALRAALRRLETRARTAEQDRRNVHHVEGT